AHRQQSDADQGRQALDARQTPPRSLGRHLSRKPHLRGGIVVHAIPLRCTTAKRRVISRWENEDVLEAVQERLDRNPDAMRTRREVVEHPFGTIKMRMGATHFLCKTLPKVATEMALAVLTYNLTRVINIVGVKELIKEIQTA
ncbi:MAG: transposase, partial [Alphaproteobacteria bacterium]|nr:transposase [Alphaproteobacteria bacterium]